ncbi:tetratricopeptide repeat protein [Streptomyces sp. NPDC059862]|uniref:tetratricopeptide repeat protein n=1 Tax=Streptomyces sp. NPDC059862 TaxID=3346975 RepID=UPI0036649A60
MMDGANGPLQRIEASGAAMAYAVTNGDMHLWPDRGPVFLLQEHRCDPMPDTAWLLGQPSRMLNARHALVDFTGRDSERAALDAWRDAPSPRLAARWLHAPGGQGKTRLAEEFARGSTEAGWKVIIAVHGPGSILQSGRQDLTPGTATGVLLVVDYADRWPLSHLTRLFSNTLLHRDTPARILLLARTAHGWPTVRAELEKASADTSDARLAPLPDGPDRERERMFVAARDSFARVYGFPDPTAIGPPGPLGHPDFGLTLTLHMAALVAVDATARGVRPPDDMTGLSAYLLDRERGHWKRLYENRCEGLEFATPPREMARAVFTAVLTGPMGHAEAASLLNRLSPGVTPTQILDDHALCYPPADPCRPTVLEPLYPDRLAEDFLALSLPGHEVSGHPADSWAATAPATLLALHGPGTPPSWVSRAITFLIAAAERWPHLAAGQLAHLLTDQPELALHAGGTALTALAGVPGLPRDALNAVYDRLPRDSHVDLDVGAAALAARLARLRLAETDSAFAHARANDELARRLFRVGQYEEAATAAQESLRRAWEPIADNDLERKHAAELAEVLTNTGEILAKTGKLEDALVAARRAVEILRHEEESQPGDHQSSLAGALNNLSLRLRATGQYGEAHTMAEEAVALYVRLAADAPAAYEADLAMAHSNLGICLQDLGQTEDALVPARSAYEICRRLVEDEGQWDTVAPLYAETVGNLGVFLWQSGRLEEALPLAEKAVSVRRKLVKANPAAHTPSLATALANYGGLLLDTGHDDKAEAPAREAVGLLSALAAADRDTRRDLAVALYQLGRILRTLDWPNEAATVAMQAVDILRRLAAEHPAAYEASLAEALIEAVQVRVEAREHLPFTPEAAAQAVKIYRDLAQAMPHLYDAPLRHAQAVQAMALAAVGRGAEARSLLGSLLERGQPPMPE